MHIPLTPDKNPSYCKDQALNDLMHVGSKSLQYNVLNKKKNIQQNYFLLPY